MIQRYHYLRYRVPVGAHLRYMVRAADGRLLACLLWTSAAWKMAVRKPLHRSRGSGILSVPGRPRRKSWLKGNILAQKEGEDEGIVMAKIVLDERIGSGTIRSRRPEIYGGILTKSSDRNN